MIIARPPLLGILLWNANVPEPRIETEDGMWVWYMGVVYNQRAGGLGLGTRLVPV